MRKLFALAEVAVVLALFGWLLVGLRGTPLAAWQQEHFGSAPVSASLLFFVLPLLFLLAGRRNPGLYGLAGDDLAYHRRAGLRAAWVLLPIGILFPVIGLLGSTHEEWLGASILTAGILAAGSVVVRRMAAIETREPRAVPFSWTSWYVGLLVAGAIACFALNLFSGLLAQIVVKLVFVGFLEEYFFRGYLQSRLNDAFGRPFELGGVGFGAGLILSAALFGVMHPLSSLEGTPWPWGLWTGAAGLVFGYLREKSGSAVAPGIAHGLWVLPTAFFAP